jgi:hypothetical protein
MAKKHTFLEIIFGFSKLDIFKMSNFDFDPGLFLRIVGKKEYMKTT